jgi:hypothetical protein
MWITAACFAIRGDFASCEEVRVRPLEEPLRSEALGVPIASWDEIGASAALPK